MTESEIAYPKSRLDLAFMLERLHFNVNDSINELLDILGLDEDKKASVSCLFRRINTSLKKSHRPIESLSKMNGGTMKYPGNHAQRRISPTLKVLLALQFLNLNIFVRDFYH